MTHFIKAGLMAGALFMTTGATLACSGETGTCYHDTPPHSTSTALSHGPIGVMGDHMHAGGEYMLSYRFMRMGMSGLRDGTDDLSSDALIASTSNNVAPTDMDMTMHMLGGMWGVTDDLTLMVMGRYLDNDMTSDVYNMMGTAQIGQSSVSSQGWGDTSLTSLWQLYDHGPHHVHLNAGLSLPTGSITESDTMLMPSGMTMDMRLGYGMQLGSGTYDLLPGLTYFGQSNQWGWGAQYMATIRTGENDEGYKLGDRHQITAWAAHGWADWLSTSLRLSASHEGRIDGRDPQIIMMSPVADPDNYGGERIEAGLGVNLLATDGALRDHRLAFEVAAPLYEDLNGPQLKRDYTATIGWQYAF